MLSKIQIIEETVEYYKTHNRAIDNKTHDCYYYRNGDTCPIGRCMENPEEFNNAILNVLDIHKEYGIDKVLKEEYKGHHVKFWENLQNLHDCMQYWTTSDLGDNVNDLTESGLECYNKLIEIYKD